jgi:TolB-like protein/class 3 adenylate cyclase
MEHVERRLAAVLGADVAGYSRLMGVDEEGTLAQLKTFRRTLVDPTIAKHRGHIVKTTGDGMLVEFASAVEAARCAVEVQRGMAGKNTEVPQAKRIEFRIGIHLGDIIIDDNDIFGDGVNIAARLEGLAEPGGVCISDDAQRQIRGKVNIAFDDMGLQTLKNIAEPMHAWRMQLGNASVSAPPKNIAAESRPVLPLPNKPSFAVMPFQNMSGDPEQEYFVDGMVEEITTALSRIGWLFVIARNSSFTYKGHAVDATQVGRELGVRYLLEGSLRKAGKRVRITAQLIDATSGAHLWADNFDGTMEDIFELQDTVASHVAGVIEPTLQVAEYRRSAQRPTNDLTAYDLYLRARAEAEPWERQRMERALELLGHVLDRDPNYGSALAVATTSQVALYLNNWTNDLEATRHAGIDFARRALRVAGDDPYVLANAAYALGLFGEDIAVAHALMDRSLRLNPNFAWAWLRSGWLRLRAGKHALGIKHCEASIRLSPRKSLGSTWESAWDIFLQDAWTMPRRCFVSRSRRNRAGRQHIAFWHPAMLIWDD